MGSIVAVVGNTGAGKTTLVRALCRSHEFNLGLEQHAERPFQSLFKSDPKYALANQMDYLLQRAKQELDFRNRHGAALLDGGLDMDFHGFTRLFRTKGYLSEPEFTLCKDLYLFIRSILPVPDLIIHLTADEITLAKRLADRNRINIAEPEDLELLNSHLIEWLSTLDPDRIITIDATRDDVIFSRSVPVILDNMVSMHII